MTTSYIAHLGRSSAEFGRADGPGETGLLFEIWGILRRRWAFVCLGFIAGLAIAVLYYVFVQRIYEATVQIVVMEKDANLPAQAIERERAEEPSTFNDLLVTHVLIFKSPRVIQRAIEKHHLDRLPTFVEESRKLKNFDPVEYISSPKQLAVSKGGEALEKDARVLRASFRGPSREDCVAVLDALVESYQAFLGETFEGTSSEAVRLISEAKQGVEGELAGAEDAYYRFREQAPLLSRGDQKAANPCEERLRDINSALTQTRIRQTEVRTRLEVVRESLKNKKANELNDLEKLALIGPDEMQRISLMLATTRGDANNSEAFQSKQPQRLVAAEAELHSLLSLMLRERELLVDYGEEHPEVLKIRKQIEMGKQFLSNKSLPDPLRKFDFNASDLLAAQVTLLEHDLAQFEKREKQLVSLSEQEVEAAKKIASAEIRDEILRTDILRKRGLYDAIVDRLKKINLIKDYGGYLTPVIAPVQASRNSVFPILLLFVAVGGFLGLFSGVGLAYFVDLVDRTFRTPEEVHRLLEIPILGDIPPIRAAQPQTARATNGRDVLAIDAKVVAYHRPQSREAEAIRGLRATLCSTSRGDRQKVIQVTSPASGDGKTILAANLAVSLSRSGRKVLLVDGDLHHPMIAKTFAIDSAVGLSAVLAGEADLPDAVQNVGIENLTVLPAGTCPPNPSELLLSPEFERLLAVVREQYDYVLLDSPPLLAISDSLEMASRADGVLLTIRIRKNGAPTAVQARQMLDAVHAKVLGVVVNGFQKSRHYSYGYSNSYGQVAFNGQNRKGRGEDDNNGRDGEQGEA